MRNIDNAQLEQLEKKRKKKKIKYMECDEASRLQKRARYLLIRIKLEQNLIDAYSGDGWKGQSKEKIKPDKELNRAEKQIIKCKLGIREIIHQLDNLGSIGRIEDSFMQPDGSIFHEHIICSKCKSGEIFPDNDIILCDGSCNCAYHQKCLDPPLDKIPPGDEGWLCKFCESKQNILEDINAYLCTSFTVDCSFQDIFKEATVNPNSYNSDINPDEDWPSDESEDSDYKPELLNEFSSSDSSSSSGTEATGSDNSDFSEGQFCNIDYSVLGDNCEIIDHPRKRKHVDYRKLHDEMFGKDGENKEESEDEEWGPQIRKDRRIEIESDVDHGTGGSSAVSDERASLERKRAHRIPPESLKAKINNCKKTGKDNGITLMDKSYYLPLSKLIGASKKLSNLQSKNNKRFNMKERMACQTDKTKCEEQLSYLDIMERLCILENRVCNLKKVLSKYRDSSSDCLPFNTNLHEQSANVMYVPIVRLMEKA